MILTAIVIGLPLVGAVCWRLASQYNPVQDAMSNDAYGDVIAVPTDAARCTAAMTTLNGIVGTGCEAGSPIHSERN